MEDIIIVLSLVILFLSGIILSKIILTKLIKVITVYEYERGIRYHKGKLIGELKPGQYLISPLRSPN